MCTILARAVHDIMKSSMHKFFVGLRNVGLWLRQKAMGVVVFALVVGLTIPMHFANAVWAELTDFVGGLASAPFVLPILLFGTLIQGMVALFGGIMLGLIYILTSYILPYNGFYHSNIVGLGWALTRDTVNMFVVAILIFIAVATIIGYSKVSWMQQLPKLFLAIVFVNFSKLICGILIDVSQVIMFTFVNAIVSIAAGNFATMFGIVNMGNFSATALNSAISANAGVSAMQMLASSIFDLFMIMAVGAIMLLLTMAFIWRIVVLWLLIIMSPLAFFAWGIGDMVHFAGKISSDWWSKMISALTFGPIMAFFLWLALAASSGGNIVENEVGFTPADGTLNFGVAAKSFEPSNFFGAFIAIFILLAGMQQAATAAGAMGGFAATMMKPETLSKAVKGTGKAVLTGGKDQREWLNKKGKEGGVALAAVSPGLAKGLGTGMANLGTKLSGSKIPGMGALGAAVGTLGSNVTSGSKDAAKESLKKGTEANDKRTDEQKLAMQRGRADAESPDATRHNTAEARAFMASSDEERNADTKKLLTDPEARTKYQEDLAKHYASDANLCSDGKPAPMSKEQAAARAQLDTDDVMRKSIDFSEDKTRNAALGLGADDKKAIEKMKAQNLHLVEPKDGQKSYRTPDGTAWKSPTAEAEYRAAKRKAQTELLTKMKDEKTLDIRTMSTAAFGDPDTRETLKKFETEKDVYAWDQFLEGKGTTKQQAAAVSNITADDIRTSPDARKNVAQLVSAGAVGSAADLDATTSTGYADTPTGQRMNAVREHLLANAGVNSKSYGAATAKLLSASSAPNADATAPVIASVLGAGFSAAAVGTDDAMKTRVDSMLQADASSSRHLASFVPSNLAPDSDPNANATNANLANPITERIATNFKVTDIERLRGEKVPSADREKNERALTVAATAIRIQHARAVRDGDKDGAKRLADKGDALGVTLRYTTRPARPAPGPDPYAGGGD